MQLEFLRVAVAATEWGTIDLQLKVRGEQIIMPESEILDYAEFLARVGGDEAFARELLSDFIEILPTEVESLRAIVSSGNQAELAAKVHSIKGAAANLSAKQLAALAESMEVACRGGDLETARSIFPRLSQAAHLLIERASAL